MYKLTDTNSIIRLSDNAIIPTDEGNRDYQNYLVWVAEGNSPAPVDPPSSAQIQAALTTAVQAHLDASAKARGYDDIVSACSYAGAPNPFQEEAITFLQKRAACWQYGYQVLAECEAGTRAIPSSDELLGELPLIP